MIRSAALPIVWLALVVVAAPPCCESAQRRRSAWPPDDFRLELKYTIVSDGHAQVQQHVRIFADGLVVYREADTSLRSADGGIELPVYLRVSAYRMQWKSIRSLSRELHRAPVTELEAQASVPSTDQKTHLIVLHLISMANVVDVVAENQAIGLMNRVVRIVNAFLPENHAITMPGMLGDAKEHRLQDVPPVAESVRNAKQFHEEWLADNKGDIAILRDTFALACEAKDWSLAQSCVAQIVVAEPTVGAALEDILKVCRTRPR